MFTFLHTADIHLDSPLLKLEHYEGAPVDQLRGATRRAFENLVRLAIDTPADFVLISGDLYDGDWQDYNTGLYFVSQMAKLREAEIPVYIIAGNHDAASKMTKTLRLPDNIHIFPDQAPHTFYLRVGSGVRPEPTVVIHGQSFSAPAVKKNLAAAYPEAIPGNFNIGMLHTGATGQENHEPYAPCTPGELCAKGYDYWALGHIHQQEILSQSPWIVFPGNIQGRNIRETGPKGCMKVTVYDNGTAVPEFHPLDVVRWIRCVTDVSRARTGDDVLGMLFESLEAASEANNGMLLAARIEMTGISSAHAELTADTRRWVNEIRGIALDAGRGNIWIEKVRFHTQPPIEKDLPSDGPVGELLQFLDEMSSDPDHLGELGKSLDGLWKRLPREFKHEKDTISPDNAQWLTEILRQIRPMLLKRLMSEGDNNT